VPETADFTNCPNCGAPVVGNFCPECGQRIADVKIGVKPLFLDLLEDQFSLGSALPRTLKSLFFKPGCLTSEYLSLRIARYVAPFRLYLIASLIFFLLLTFLTRSSLQVNAGSMNEVADSLATAISAAQRADSIAPDSSARKAAAPVDSTRPTQTVADTKRCGRFGSGAALASGPISADSAKVMSMGLTTDSSLVFGLAADASKKNWAANAQVDFGSERLDRAVCLRLLQLGALPPDEAVRRLITQSVRNLPKVMFVLLPLYAFLLKLVYIRRKRFYVEHFVFALHLHAFMFLLFTLMLLLRNVEVLPGLLFLWMCIYSWIAMKRVYGQGWLKTTFKWFTIGWAYLVILSLGAVTVFVGAIFTA
jgi:hypothetical protein